MPQKGRKTAVIVSFLCPVELLSIIDAAVAEQQSRTRAVPLNRSSWILRAIKRDLDHRQRSRSKQHAGEGQQVIGQAAGGSADAVYLPLDNGQSAAGSSLEGDRAADHSLGV